MESGKQKRARLLERRRIRRERQVLLDGRGALLDSAPWQGLPVDRDALGWTGYNSYGAPDFVTCGRYVARPFVCRDCGSREVWSAEQQKWWYETVHGSLYSTAVRCRNCRKEHRRRRAPLAEQWKNEEQRKTG